MRPLSRTVLSSVTMASAAPEIVRRHWHRSCERKSNVHGRVLYSVIKPHSDYWYRQSASLITSINRLLSLPNTGVRACSHQRIIHTTVLGRGFSISIRSLRGDSLWAFLHKCSFVRFDDPESISPALSRTPIPINSSLAVFHHATPGQNSASSSYRFSPCELFYTSSASNTCRLTDSLQGFHSVDCRDTTRGNWR